MVWLSTQERLGKILSSSATMTVQTWALLQIHCTRLGHLVPPANLASHVTLAFVLPVMLRSQQLRGEALRGEALRGEALRVASLRGEALKDKALMLADRLELEALWTGKTMLCSHKPSAFG